MFTFAGLPPTHRIRTHIVASSYIVQSTTWYPYLLNHEDMFISGGGHSDAEAALTSLSLHMFTAFMPVDVTSINYADRDMHFRICNPVA